MAIYHEHLTETIKVFDGHKGRGIRAGMSRSKGTFVEFRSMPSKSQNLSMARVERIIDREHNKYCEKVTDCQTGEVLHEQQERLSDHKGHGSDKVQARIEIPIR